MADALPPRPPDPYAAARQNRLLRALPPATLRPLLPALEPVTLRARAVLLPPEAPIEAVYFPLHGMASLVHTFDDGAVVEVATVGNEGVVGLPLFLGVARMVFTAIVEVPGAALRLEAAAFRRLTRRAGGAGHALLARYTQAFLTHLGQHVACHRRHPVAQRCAHWLLMTHDRVGQATFPLTHDFLGQMLGVRRATVTTVAGRLSRAGLIRYHRGMIQVLDRPGLEAASCECYRVIRQTYDRLLGPG